jgi:hypothetical protein
VCECVGAVESGARSSSGEMDTAVPGRSETLGGATLFALPQVTAVSKASVLAAAVSAKPPYLPCSIQRR